MKKFVFLLPVIGAIYILVSAYSGNNALYPGGSPAGYTGSPADGKNCTFCHGGTASSVTGWITSNVETDGYIPGNTYTITVAVSGSGDKGFEVSPQDLSGNLIGTLAPGSGNKLVGSGKYVTQNSASSLNPKVWTFSWTAPATGVGDVIFYGAFTVNKPVTKLSTLTIPQNIFTSIQDLTIQSFSIYPNPADDHLTFKFSAVKPGPFYAYLVNIQGSRVADLVRTEMASGENEFTFELPAQAGSGIYFLVVECIGQRFSRKVMIL